MTNSNVKTNPRLNQFANCASTKLPTAKCSRTIQVDSICDFLFNQYRTPSVEADISGELVQKGKTLID